MNREKLFTVLIPHYNQKKFWKTSVLSVLEQNYPYIELVFIDDASESFDSQELAFFIRDHAADNLVNYRILVNESNLGTVKSLNRAHKYCSGHYILHFAADDRLYDADVLKHFAFYLEQKSDDVLGIYGRSLKYDSDLGNFEEDFLPIERALEMNRKNAPQQFTELLFACHFPLGATAFIFEELKNYIPFCEDYFLQEDWPFFLKATRLGKKFVFANFPALMYRAGGVSRPVTAETTKARKLLFQDYFCLHEKEIFPFTKGLKGKELTELLGHYDDVRHDAQSFLDETPLIKRYQLLQYNIHFLTAFRKQVNPEQKSLLEGSFLAVLTIILDFILLADLWQEKPYETAMLLLLTHAFLCTAMLILFCKGIISGYKSIKYYLFSPYR